MKMRTIGGCALVLPLLAACGGGSKPSTGATTTPAASAAKSDVKFTLPTEPPETVRFDGKAIGFYVKAMNAFNIVVADAALEPGLTCDMIAHPKPTKGGFIDMWFADAHPKVGKTEIPGAAVVRIDPVKKAILAGNALTEKVTADFKTVDATSFTVEISSAADARGPASGTIVGTMCPDVDGAVDSSGGDEGPTAVTSGTTAAADGLQVSIDSQQPIEADVTQMLAKFDPKSKTFVVAAFPPASKPTCDWLAAPTKAGKTGSVLLLFATPAKSEPGLYDLPTAEALDLAKGTKVVGPVYGSLAVSALDDKHLTAQMMNSGKGPGFINGGFTANVCPNGAIAIPKAEAAKKPTDKKK